MPDLVVIMSLPYIFGTLKLYLHQLDQAGIEYRTVKPHPCQNLGGKVDGIRRVVSDHMEYRAVVISDPFDVLFFGTKAEVLGKIPDHGVLQAAEKNCYPEEIGDKIHGSTPWRFVNGGLLAGTPRSFLSWCDDVERHPDYNPDMVDQAFFNRRLSESSPLCVLDNRTDVFFCLCKGYEELQFESGRPRNTLCDTHPNFIHANGSYETGSMWIRYLESLKCQA